MKRVADRHLDCVGLFCPMPILRTRDALSQMAVGEVLEMRSDDPAAEDDLQRWTARTGHDLLEIVKDGPVFRFLVRKAR